MTEKKLYTCDICNDNIRKQFDNIIHGNPPKTEREKEIDKLAREELEEYRRKKKRIKLMLL